MHQAGDLAQAEMLYRQVLTLEPDLTPAHANLGAALLGLGRFDDAVAACTRAIEHDPEHVTARNTRGAALRSLGRPLEALADFDAVLARRPDHAQAHNNRGNALREMGRYPEALSSYARARAVKPDYGRAIHNESLCRLLLGDFDSGWSLYESRGLDDQLAPWRRTFTVPRWSREANAPGKTVLLHAEQGSGDALQFVRYAPLVAACGADVVLEVHRELVTLLARVDGVRTVVANRDPLPHIDFECPLMSLPFAFGTRMDTVPANVPYVRTDHATSRQWSERIGRAPGPKIGVAWSGSAAHVNDRNRSIPLASFLTALPEGARYYSVKKDVRASDAAARAGARHLQHFGELLTDFDQTAALIGLMDLVVTVDTAVAHPAGALGKPVWILLPFDPDWRWLLDRDNSPWYPTARLLRQPSLGNWRAVLARCRDDLEDWLASRK